MTTALLARIIRSSGVPHLLEILSEHLPPTDLQSLLLEVYRRRALRVTPAHLLDQYERNRFVRPSQTPPQIMLAFDRLAFSLAAPPFEPIDLSPVCPLGTNSAVAAVSQHRTIATIRNTELVSDSTNVLAQECASSDGALLRERPQATDRVRLCTSHRVLRPQRTQGPVSLAHFRLFALCTAGRDEGSLRFECDSLQDHLSFYLRLLLAWADDDRGGTAGRPITQVRVAITPLATALTPERLYEGVIEPLAGTFPAVHFALDPERTSGHGYYEAVCFHIYAQDAAGREYQLVDGGGTNWTQTLLSDRKERLLISGLGSERLCTVFCPTTA